MNKGPIKVVRRSSRLERKVRTRVVHGGEGSEAEILNAIDSGLTILRQLDSIDVPDDQPETSASG